MKVIAKKSRSSVNNPTLGYIQPVLKFDVQEQSYKGVDQSDFPNDGEIFVIKGYNFIDSDFAFGELFEIDDIKTNDSNYDSSRSGSCLYTSTNPYPKKINRWEYLPIYDSEFDLEKRTARNINDSNVKDGQAFFIRNEEYLYGPFTYDIITLSALPIDYFDNNDFLKEGSLDEFLSNSQDFIFRYRLDAVQDAIVENYVTSLPLLLKKKPEKSIYFGTKENIIDWGKRKFSSKLNDSERAILDKLKEFDTPDSHHEIEQQKITLFKQYIGEANTWLNIELPKYFSEFLASEDGSNHINKYLEDNKESFFIDYRKSEVQEKDKLIQQKSEQLESLDQKILEIEQKLTIEEDKTFEGIPEDEKKQLKAIITNEKSRSHFLTYYNENRNLEEAQEQFKKLENQREYLDSQIAQLTIRLDTIKNAIKNAKSEIFDEKEFAKKVIDAKIYTDLLNNIDPSQDEESGIIQTNYILPTVDKRELTTKQFIDEINLRLEKLNRKISFNDLVNYLILLNQNFITVVAGLPGVGKTSLVEKLAHAIGSFKNKRYLKIPVARGWTSSKDLIGYYNPLTKKYQSSKTDLYSFLKICERDVQNNTEVPSIVLLDEANLSPIEHYWSEFLSLADLDYQRVIKTTDKESISFGDGVRFIATINYDHTTEMLSDRLLSRAPIIKLNVADYTIEETQEIASTFSEVYSMVQLNSHFNKNTQKDYFKGDIKNKFDSVVKTLQDDEGALGQPIIIGMRKYKSVERFCAVAGNIMLDPNKFIALDYAINQHILPLINGRGDLFAKRLLDLREKLQGLPQSLKSVNKIIQTGNDNFKNYKFFN